MVMKQSVLKVETGCLWVWNNGNV